MKILSTYPAFIYWFLSVFLIISCAKKGSIYGGPKDEIPPRILKIIPENKSTEFSSNEIRIHFDELVEFQNPYEKVLISPPLASKPEFSPLGYSSRVLKIRFQDSLKSNTTYSVHFGGAIVDSNEKNPMVPYSYSFSTGAVLDSLRFKGEVFYVNSTKNAADVSVMLYPFKEQTQDSLAYTTFPKYMTTTKANGSFELEYLSPGEYTIVALDDENKNYFFDPSRDQIGFSNRKITLPSKSPISLGLFEPIQDFEFNYFKQDSKNQFVLLYSGMSIDAKHISLTHLDGKDLKFIQKDPLLKMLHFTVSKEVTSNKIDSLAIIARYKNIVDTLVCKIQKDMLLDSLKLQLNTPKFHKGRKVLFSANLPLCDFDPSKIKIVNQDSINQEFNYRLNSLENTISLDLNTKPTKESTYQLYLEKDAIRSCDNQLSAPTFFDIKSLPETTYGKLKVVPKGFPVEMPLLVQLYKNQELQATQTTTNTKPIHFEYLDPGAYTIKVVLDQNANGYWDTGSYLKRIAPEVIYFFPKELDIRANWEVNQQIDYQDPFLLQVDQ